MGKSPAHFIYRKNWFFESERKELDESKGEMIVTVAKSQALGYRDFVIELSSLFKCMISYLNRCIIYIRFTFNDGCFRIIANKNAFN